MLITTVWTTDTREPGPAGWLLADPTDPPARIRGRVRGRTGGPGTLRDYELVEAWRDGAVYRPATRPGGTGGTLVPRFRHDGTEAGPPGS